MNLQKNTVVLVQIQDHFYNQPHGIIFMQEGVFRGRLNLFGVLKKMVGRHIPASAKEMGMPLSSFLSGLESAGFDIDVVRKRSHKSGKRVEFTQEPTLSNPIFYVIGLAYGRGQLDSLVAQVRSCENPLFVLSKTGEKYRNWEHLTDMVICGNKPRRMR